MKDNPMTNTDDMFMKLFDDVTLELQSLCNRDCFFCPRTYDTTGMYIDENGKEVIQKLPTEMIISVLDQLQEMGFTGKVSNHHLSEPLIDKRAIDIAWEVRKRGMLPVMNTNGDPIRGNEKLLKKCAEVYRHIVIGIYDLDEEQAIKEEKEYWLKALEGTMVFFSVIPPTDGKKLDFLQDGDGAHPRTNVPDDERMRWKKEKNISSPCHRPLERILIHYDGRIGLCCEDHYGAFDLGNVFDTPVKDIWYSEKRLNIVRDLMDGRRDKYDLCKNCPHPATVGPRGWEGEQAYRERY